ncbi:MAG TPA: efflux RND transporter periplasmic adaptor subunit [Alphaproteobacteria bacterium]|nr:efflux RND transporter periplasmic adaptor subunit [Alphaproteobacteria bacterium]
MRKLLVAVPVIGLIVGGAAYFALSGGKDAPTYRTAKVERGAIVSAVSASGTLAAVVTVQVGSQISGLVKEILVDFNSEVRQGQLIARLDPATYEARLKQAEADLALARATVKTQQAAVLKSRASLTNAEKDLARQRALSKEGYAAAATLEKSQSTQETSKAELAMAEAQVENALAAVMKQEAAVNAARIDLDRTYIRAPVDGTVISRDVDVGQTVAATMSAPVLFKIAQDLHKMQVEVRIDEADVGRIREGQRASFTVDSFQGRTFNGAVSQIRKASTTVQNVVTYSVLVSADNDDLRLLPGLTANVRIVIDERVNVLKIANAALRFRPVGAGTGEPANEPGEGAPVASGPQGAQPASGRANEGPGGEAQQVEQLTKQLNLTADQQQQVRALIAESRERLANQRQQARAPDGNVSGGTANSAQRANANRARAQFETALAALLTPEQQARLEEIRVARGEAANTRRGQVWILEGGKPKAINVVTGVTDGGFTELLRGELKEGQEIVVGMNFAAKSASSAPRFGF